MRKYRKIKIFVSFFIFIVMLILSDKKVNADEIINSEVIEEGEYRIISAQDNTLVFDIVGGYKTNGTLLELWKKNYGMNQTFIINKSAKGEYEIIAKHSGLALDVFNNNKTEGTSVEQYQKNGQDNQKWYINKTQDGYYNFISKASGLYLDVNTTNAKCGSFLQIFNANGKRTQEFLLEKVDNLKKEKSLDDGVYQIKLFSNPDYCLDVGNASKQSGTSISVWKNNKAFNQRFMIEYDNNGYYTIKALHSNLCLDVYNGDILNGTDVIQWKENGGTNQKWVLQRNDDGSFYIISKGNELFLNADVENKYFGANINTRNKLKEEIYRKFYIEAIDFKESQRTIEDGIYQIACKSNDNFVLDIEGDSNNNCANLELWNNKRNNNQKFNITYIDGYYHIQVVSSGKMLDVHGAGFVGGTNVEQYASNSGDNQKWIIEKNDNGCYKFYSKCNELVLTNNSDNTYGSNVYVDFDNNAENQNYYIREVELIPQGTYKISALSNNAKYFDIENNSTDNNANVLTYIDKNQKNQMFKIEYVEGNYFKLLAINSGLAITELNGNICQSSYEGKNSQLWKAEKGINDTFKLKSKLDGKYITVDSSNNVVVSEDINSEAQMLKFMDITEGIKGVYGKSGLKYKGDSKGRDLEYYRFGYGENVYFATFTVHGFEDNWNWDGWELQWIANNFYNKLLSDKNENIAQNWTIYIFPTVNPDGLYCGYTNNGPGRTTFYSSSPTHKGIDINRSWQTDSTYKTFTSDRNYNGTAGFQAYESAALRDFLLKNKSINGRTILVDLHGWENSLIGNTEVLTYFADYFPNATKKYESYGQQYMITWGRAVLGAQVGLVELPSLMTNHDDVVNNDLSGKYINSVYNMLNGVSINNSVYGTLATSNFSSASLGKVEINKELDDFGIAVAGVIYKSKPTTEQIEDYKNLDIDTGIYIIPGYEEKLLNLINSLSNNEFGLNESNFLIVVNESSNKNKYDLFFEKLINSNNSYLFSSMGEIYFRDEVTNEVTSNIYEFMDKYQTFDYAKYDNKMLIDIPKNEENKLSNKEIIDSLIELIKE